MLIESKIKLIRTYPIKARSRLRIILSSQIISNVRAICRELLIIVFIMIGMRASIAEVEEVSVPTQFGSEYVNSSFPFYVILTVPVNAYDSIGSPHYSDDEIREYIANNTNKRNAATSRRDKSGVSENLNIFRDVFVPDAVWSFDSSTGVHFEHNSSELASEFATMPEEVKKNADFWTRPSLSVWNGDDRVVEIIAPSPTIIQVASCGGDYVERSDLDYCNIGENAVNESNKGSTELQDHINAATPPQNISNSIAPSTTSTSTQETEEPPTTPALVTNTILPNNVIDLSSLSDQCVDTSASCATTQPAATDSPPTPTDSPPTPTDFPPPLTPPVPVISVGDPGPIPGLPIPSTPPLVASPVPESSTWIMMIIGFGIMIVARRRRAPNRIKRDTVGPAHTSANGQWRC